MKKVLVSFPTDPSDMTLHKEVVFASWKLLHDKRYSITPIIPTHRPYENNLHHIVVDFIKGDYDFWLNIDSDNPPLNNPLDLIELDKDIIGLPTPIWHFTGEESPGERPIYWNAYDYVKELDAYREHQNRDGLQEVDAIGTGCFIIARRVFLNPKLQCGAFNRKLKSDGTVNKGNDIAFCERARNEGFNIYAHYDYPCNHFSSLELHEIIRGFKNLQGD